MEEVLKCLKFEAENLKWKSEVTKWSVRSAETQNVAPQEEPKEEQKDLHDSLNIEEAQ